ncbi:MAG: zinc ribbon domain-containing protein [Candidatus Thermoplasmatota archaeon]|nr:zinc ribbon domain-containing protein [Candidatus Thermoplasmatota archaeon]
MTDEESVERKKALIEDRRSQAAWYESLHLYAEAMKIYRAIEDDGNIQRLTMKMKEEYSGNAGKMERSGKFQEAANLYYLLGDKDGVERMKKFKPDLVILYDEEEGGLAKIAMGLGPTETDTDGEMFFRRPNPSERTTREERQEDQKGTIGEAETSEEIDLTPMGRKGISVKMPLGVKKMRFCPYCGERINTKKNPKFCPFCGDELA